MKNKIYPIAILTTVLFVSVLTVNSTEEPFASIWNFINQISERFHISDIFLLCIIATNVLIISMAIKLTPLFFRIVYRKIDQLKALSPEYDECDGQPLFV